MRNKQELNDITIEWAYGSIEACKEEWDWLDYMATKYNLTDEELNYCTSRNFTISIFNVEK